MGIGWVKNTHPRCSNPVCSRQCCFLSHMIFNHSCGSPTKRFCWTDPVPGPHCLDTTAGGKAGPLVFAFEIGNMSPGFWNVDYSAGFCSSECVRFHQAHLHSTHETCVCPHLPLRFFRQLAHVWKNPTLAIPDLLDT